MISITSKREGFRRCGVAHTKKPVEYPDNKFSEKEITIMEADPMLVVKYADDPMIAKTSALKDMTVASLKKLLGKLDIAYDGKATKTVLIDLVEANTGEPPV